MNGSPLIRRLAINVITTDSDAGKERSSSRTRPRVYSMYKNNLPKPQKSPKSKEKAV